MALACWAAAVMAAAGSVAGGPWGVGVPASHRRSAAAKSSAWRGAFGLGGKRDTLQRCVRGRVGVVWLEGRGCLDGCRSRSSYSTV